MSAPDRQLFLCSCNGTQPLDAAAIARALDLEDAPPVSTMLCQKEMARFSDGAQGDVLVACTQEARLFEEMAAEGSRTQTIRFVNLREAGGWSPEARGATPKLAALIAAASLPEPAPVSEVSYESKGELLIVGPLDAAMGWAKVLAPQLAVTVLATGRTAGASLPAERTFPIASGGLSALKGWLGAFEATWSQDNPIDLDLCTRCHACVRACPEHAIDESYQIDLDRCRDHRECVVACGAIGAIDFDRKSTERSGHFDLVLDLQREPSLRMHQPPQGYLAPGADVVAQAKAVAELATMTGEFVKPKYFAYKASICAHSRSRKTGCTACIDVCSTQAIRADGDGVAVEPHLCMGCGACATVCPSGAMTYAYPAMPDQGARVRTMLATYARAGGRDAALLIHSQEAGASVIETLGRAARIDAALQGLPARVLPLEVWHTASVGIDLWLAAIAFGAAQVWVLVTHEEAPAYREAIDAQIKVAQAILAGLGFVGEHFRIVGAGEVSRSHDREALSGPAGPAARSASPRASDPALLRFDAALRRPAAATVRRAATFAVQPDKRTTLDLVFEHLLREAPTPADVVALPAPAGAPSPCGDIVVDKSTCTLCLACVGACPEGALVDHPDSPRLSFIEKNCVQCGLCASTCPEDAITLVPRLLLADGGKARRQPRVLHEAEPFRCIRCGKPFGTLRAIETMVAKLSGHAMFQGHAAQRLQMCSDCRVIDLHSDPGEVRITEL